MRKRCSDRATGRARKNYFDRGIRVCPEWESSFEAFFEWAMKNGYADNLQIDREDNDGNYEPGNCRWVTNTVNGRNKRNTKLNECEVQDMHEAKKAGARLTDIARGFGLSKSHAWAILSGRLWKEFAV